MSFFNEQTDYKFIKLQNSTREKKLTLYKGFLFCSYSSNKSGIDYLRCNDRNCPVRAKLHHGRFLLTSAVTHNHEDREDKARALEIYMQLKQDVLNSPDTTRQIFDEAIAGVRIFKLFPTNLCNNFNCP